MRLLAIDTTTRFLSLGLYDKGKVAEYNLSTGHKLSQLLVPIIEKALSALNLNLGDIDYFAGGCGPGSFTGIRLGLSTLKGFSFALDKPAIGISTLDILALNAPVSGKKIVPVIDAKRGLVYTCVYKYNKGKIVKNSPYLLISKEEFIKRFSSDSIVFGDGINLLGEDLLRRTGKITLLDKDTWYPKAHNLIMLAIEKIEKDLKRVTFNLNPIYLYPKDCQIRKGK